MDYYVVVICAVLALSATSSDGRDVTTNICDRKEGSMYHLDVAVDMISKVKNNLKTCDNLAHRTLDCTDLFQVGHTKSGLYRISPANRVTEDKSLEVYCDMVTDGGGWTVIQRRGDFQRPKDYFYKDWKSYKQGFGDVEKDFWLGNDNIFALTNQKLYTARFDLEDFQKNKRYAQYDTFWIDDEHYKYTLHISDYSGDAGDSLRDHDNQKFSTRDQDNDIQPDESCAEKYKGGWWYARCHKANLNGQYFRGKHDSFADGINWYTFRGYHESLAWTEIKVRPKNFRPQNSSSEVCVTSCFSRPEGPPIKIK